MAVITPCWRLFVVRRFALAILFFALLCLLFGVSMIARADVADTAVAPDALGSISGTVRDDQNQPLAGITVTAYAPLLIYDWYLVPLRTTTTLTDGQYSILALRAERYFLEFASADGTWAREYYQDAASLSEADEIVIAGNQVTGIDVTLERAGTIQGAVNILPGLLPDDGSVALYHEVNGEWQVATSTTLVTTTAAYQLSEILSGTYRVCASGSLGPWEIREYFSSCYGGSGVEQATDIVVTSGETLSGIDFSLGDGQYEGEISGRVTSADTPLAGIEVSLYTTSFWEPYIPNRLLVYTQTNAAGEYSFGGLSAGVYAVGFSDPTGEYATLYYPAQRTLYGSSPIYLLTNEIHDNINGVLSVAGAISGRVLTAAGYPASSSPIELGYWEDGYWDSQFISAPLDENGYYSLRGLTPGTYRICFPFEFIVGRPPIYGYFYQNCYGGDRFSADSWSTATELVVESGEILTNIDAVIGPELGFMPMVAR